MIFFRIFFRTFLVSGKSHSAEKCKRGPLGVFEHPLFCNIGKNETGKPLETFKKNCEKVLPSRKKPAKNEVNRDYYSDFFSIHTNCPN